MRTERGLGLDPEGPVVHSEEFALILSEVEATGKVLRKEGCDLDYNRSRLAAAWGTDLGVGIEEVSSAETNTMRMRVAQMGGGVRSDQMCLECGAIRTR